MQRIDSDSFPDRLGEAGGRDVTRWRQWPNSVVLLCLGLIPASDANCFAADPPAAQARAAPAPPKAEPPPAKPAAKRETLLGAIIDAFGGDRDRNVEPEPAIDDPNIRNMEAQFRPQFQQLLYVELAFLRRECKPDAKTFAEVAKAAKADLRVPLRKYASQWWARQRQGGRGDSNAVDPRSEIRKLLMPLVEAKLGPEQARLYRQECDTRAEARKHAVVVNLIAALDERLVLTAPQRAKLVESFSTNYETAWDQYLEMFAYNNSNYLPSIRDESIAPLLDEQQKSIWGEIAKQNGQVFFGQIIRDPLGGEAATEIQEIAHIAEEVQDGQ
jgi:hypothetical protein